MSYKEYTLLANSQNYGGTRKNSSIKYLVYHYTANKTDKAKSNANYFKNNIVKASAHYFVDDTDVYQSVPDLTIAYAVGGKKYSSCATTGGGKMYGIITNSNSISIEMCSANGKITDATLKNAAELGIKLMKKYNIPKSNVYRHFDCNGKLCPGWDGWYGKNDTSWTNFKKRLSNASSNTSNSDSSTITNPKSLYRIRKSWTDTASQIGSYSSLDNAKAACKNGYYVFDDEGNIVYSKGDQGINTSGYSHKNFILDIQKAIGAKADGIAGTETLSKTVTISKSKNNRHAVVRPIQKYLNSIGISCGSVNGIAGLDLDSAIKSFQKANGCVADGEITAKKNTWKRLLKLS